MVPRVLERGVLNHKQINSKTGMIIPAGVSQYGGMRVLSVPARCKDGVRISVGFSVALLHDVAGHCRAWPP